MEFLKYFVGAAMLLHLSTSLAATDIEILKSSFKNCEIKNKTYILSKESSKFINSSLYSYFKIDCRDQNLKAFPVRNFVKIGQQKLIVILNNKNNIEKIILREFVGGSKFKPTNSWYKKIQNNNINKIEKIDALTGATFTTRSTFEIINFLKGLLVKQ